MQNIDLEPLSCGVMCTWLFFHYPVYIYSINKHIILKTLLYPLQDTSLQLKNEWPQNQTILKDLSNQTAENFLKRNNKNLTRIFSLYLEDLNVLLNKTLKWFFQFHTINIILRFYQHSSFYSNLSYFNYWIQIQQIPPTLIYEPIHEVLNYNNILIYLNIFAINEQQQKIPLRYPSSQYHW